jgi:FG-GAP repeat protein
MEGVAVRKNLSVQRRNRRSSYSFFLLSSTLSLLWALNYNQRVYAEIDFFIQQQQLSASDKTTDGAAQLGTSVAISGTTALFGAPGADDNGSSSGTAYVFVSDDKGQWTQLQNKLLPNDGAAGKLFGNSVALDGDTALVGARGDSSQQGKNFAGAVYVFTRDASGQWGQTQKLIPNDSAAGDLFGFSVALLGDTAVIGARGSENVNNGSPGAAYVFTRGSDGTWTQQQKLTADDGTAGDGFGFSVALSDDLIVVGARNADSATGAAYTFTQDTDLQWSQLEKLTASDRTPGDEFGYSVAVNANTILIGARFAAYVSDDTVIHAGATYVFAPGPGPIGTRSNELQKLTASDGASGDEFGSSVAVNGDTALIGASNNNSAGTGSGAVYQFSFTPNSKGPGEWTQTQKIAARDGSFGDKFGSSLALSSTTALVGSPFDDIVITDDKGNTTVYTDTGTVIVLVPTAVSDACTLQTIKTDYDDVGCSGTVSASSLADLDKYVSDDYGRAGHSKYQNLALSGTLSATFLDIESPCQITLDSGTSLTGNSIVLAGRNGVVGTNGFQLITVAKIACIISEQDRTEFGASSIIRAGDLKLQAAKTAKINANTTVNVDRSLVLESTEDSSSSMAFVDTDSVVTAGSIKLTAPRTAQLGQATTVTAANELLLISTGTSSDSQAGVQADSQVQATNLTISSQRGATIGSNTSVALSGDLALTSNDTSSGSQAIVDDGAKVTVAGKADITSGNKAALNKNTTITVTGNLNMQAGTCSVSNSATVMAGSKSGNCL